MTQVKSISPVYTVDVNNLQQAQLCEAAVSICFNGISHTVMMASPSYLKDFALGFALSEGLINSASEVLNMQVKSHDNGWQVDVQVLARVEHQLKQRRRNMAGSSGCGLCGLDSIDAAMDLKLTSNLSPSRTIVYPSAEIITKAKTTLPTILKKLNGTRGNHAAVYFDLEANLIASREDVGRHSALDKLLGCLSKDAEPIIDGFVLMTSRCSHDLIVKVARLNLSTLVTLAQPTDLAVKSALKTGVTLFCFQQGLLKRFA